MKFQDFNFHSPILKAIEDQKFEKPTDIQIQSIPILIESQEDFVGQAQTGTGKTAAFVLPLLQRIKPRAGGIQALVLAPTRELAGQVEQEIKLFGKYMGINTALVYGGASYTTQIGNIKKNRPEIVVGTPGRIIDLMDRGVLDFSGTEYLILDEADEMLRMGFIEDVQTILSVFTEQRKMWMFSATMPPQILNLIKENFRNPTVVRTRNESLSNADIEQLYFVVERRQRFEALYRLIVSDENMSGIVFCATKVETKEISDKLAARGIGVDCLNGDMAQAQRENTMARLKNGKIKILVCTDVAARGIDVSGLTHVFNYGPPRDVESYVHRIGRTGRAGNKGSALLILEPNEVGYLKRVERVTNKQLVRGQLPTTKSLKANLVERETKRIAAILSAVVEKGEEFQVDPSYEIYESFFSTITKDQLQKTIFTLMFNKEFRQLNEIGELGMLSAPKSAPARRGYGAGGGGDRRSFDRRPARYERAGGRSSDRPERSDRSGGGRSDRAGGKPDRFGGKSDRFEKSPRAAARKPAHKA